MQLRFKPAIALAASIGVSLCAGAVAVPAESLAQTVPAWARYNVSFDGTAAYHVDGGVGTRTEKIDASLAYRGSVSNVTFNGTNGAFAVSASGTTTVTKADFFGVADDTDPRADPNHGACSGDTGSVFGRGTIVVPGARPDDGSISALINPFTEVGIVPLDCYGLAQRWGSAAAFSNVITDATGYEPFTVDIHLPPDAMRMGKVIQLYDQQVRPGYCPGDGPDSGVKTCTLELKGTATFLRTGVSNQLVPYPPAPGPSTPPGPPTPPGPSTRPVTSPHPEPVPTPKPNSPPAVTTKAASLSPDASESSVSVFCTGACAYVVNAFLNAIGAHASAARPLASARGVLRSGGSKHVLLRFSPRARRAIRRAGGVRLVITARVPSGRAARTRVVRLRLRHR